MDRVSNLPDDLLCRILSLLPTKLAASTPVLSKRWLNLWKRDPVYDFDDTVFLNPEEGKAERDVIRQGFVEFVDGVLAMEGDSPIEKFSLKCVTGVRSDIVNRWIRNVLQRGVSDLDLYLHFKDEVYLLPQELFVNQTLIKLKLRSEQAIDWWWGVGTCLPLLKTLDFDSELVFSGGTGEFLSSFPVLEDLRMANMKWCDMAVDVSSASIRKLSLQATGVEALGNPEIVGFETPNLILLDYTDLVAGVYFLADMKSLLGARIGLLVGDEDHVEQIRTPNNDEDAWDFGNVVMLMNAIQNVQQLSLHSDTLELLSLCCETMPVFNNLKSLQIGSSENRGWQAMPVLLRNCPHLETLIIEGLLHHVTDKCGDACPCSSREDKGHSLTSCPVNRLEIRGFRGTMKEMKMIKHFLDYFPCLKRCDVFVEENDPTQLRNREVCDLIEEMLNLYSELSSCKVELLISDLLDKKWRAQGRM